MNVIISTNAGIIFIRTLETNISEMLSEIHIFIQENVVEFVVWKMTVICLSLDVLKTCSYSV